LYAYEIISIMKSDTLIRKSSGELEPYDPVKLGRSLKRSGADEATVSSILKEIEDWIIKGDGRFRGDRTSKASTVSYTGSSNIISSRKIYDLAFSLLKKHRLGSAARYKLKKAMMEMGPTGHPFESFVGQVFNILGYSVEVAQVLKGHCVTHEVDVVATKDNHQIFLECKYYQTTGKNANVQVPLYVRSRVDDIIRMRKEDPAYNKYTFSGGVVTNTRFTEDAEKFGICSGLKLLSWDFPAGDSLREIVDREKIFPVTTLTKLSATDKQRLMEKGIVICRQIIKDPDILDSVGISGLKKKRVLDEAEEIARNGTR